MLYCLDLAHKQIYISSKYVDKNQVSYLLHANVSRKGESAMAFAEGTKKVGYSFENEQSKCIKQKVKSIRSYSNSYLVKKIDLH